MGVGRVVCRGEFVVLQRAEVSVGQLCQLVWRKCETPDYRSETSHKFASFGLMRQIWLVRPVENRPHIPLKYCALCRVADLALGVSAKEFTRQSERPCARFAV
jgi:hypothetical protein